MLNRLNLIKAATSLTATSIFIIKISFTSNEFISKAIVIVMSNISNDEAESESTSSYNLQFEYRDEFIYYLTDNEKQRLCILKVM